MVFGKENKNNKNFIWV